MQRLILLLMESKMCSLLLLNRMKVNTESLKRRQSLCCTTSPTASITWTRSGSGSETSRTNLSLSNKFQRGKKIEDFYIQSKKFIFIKATALPNFSALARFWPSSMHRSKKWHIPPLPFFYIYYRLFCFSYMIGIQFSG